MKNTLKMEKYKYEPYINKNIHVFFSQNSIPLLYALSSGQ